MKTSTGLFLALAAGLTLVVTSCSSREMGRQKDDGQKAAVAAEATQFPGFTDKQRSDLQRMLDDHKVMGMRVDGTTIFVSTGMMPEEKHREIERQIRGIVGERYEIAAIGH